jgi:thiamine-phosphate pyrophosphorylase
MNASSAQRPRGLYLITPDEADTDRLLARVRPVLAAGPTWLQYRNKGADAAMRRRQLGALLPLCREHAIPLIVNDDWRLAAELGADGAHLGEGDGELAAARAVLGAQAILGASCYDDAGRARAAAAAGASYVAFGAFFPTASKAGTRRADPALLRADRSIDLPRVAIGGITPDNAATLIAAGADLVAVIAGVFAAADPVAAVHAYLACFATPFAEKQNA